MAALLVLLAGGCRLALPTGPRITSTPKPGTGYSLAAPIPRVTPEALSKRDIPERIATTHYVRNDNQSGGCVYASTTTWAQYALSAGEQIRSYTISEVRTKAAEDWQVKFFKEEPKSLAGIMYWLPTVIPLAELFYSKKWAGSGTIYEYQLAEAALPLYRVIWDKLANTGAGPTGAEHPSLVFTRGDDPYKLKPGSNLTHACLVVGMTWDRENDLPYQIRNLDPNKQPGTWNGEMYSREVLWNQWIPYVEIYDAVEGNIFTFAGIKNLSKVPQDVFKARDYRTDVARKIQACGG